MILIFCFQSNKHWHENEPQAETSNEKMKLVFQLTDQKHFIHYNQAFIWRDLFCVCVRACVYYTVCICEGHVCVHVNTLFMPLFVLWYCLLLLHQDAAYDIFQPFVPELAGWLSQYTYVILCLIFHCCIHHSSSQINCTGQITNYTWLSCYRDSCKRLGPSVQYNNGQNSDSCHHIGQINKTNLSFLVLIMLQINIFYLFFKARDKRPWSDHLKLIRLCPWWKITGKRSLTGCLKVGETLNLNLHFNLVYIHWWPQKHNCLQKY